MLIFGRTLTRLGFASSLRRISSMMDPKFIGSHIHIAHRVGVAAVVAVALATIRVLGGGVALAQPSQHVDRAINIPNKPAEQGPEKYPQYTGLVRSGDALADSGHYLEAIKQFNKALELGPPTPRALSVLLTYRAGALWHLGRSKEALADQDRAVEADANAFALWARGETLRKLKRYAEALRDYDAALRLAPEASTYAGRGLVLWHLGKIQEALQSFNRAVALHADKYTLMQRAEFFNSREKFKKAIADYSRVIEIDPTYFPALVDRGSAYAELDEYRKALDDYNLALRTRKDDSGTYRSRGWVLERLGLMHRAKADYLRALELAPNDAWIQAALKRLSKD